MSRPLSPQACNFSDAIRWTASAAPANEVELTNAVARGASGASVEPAAAGARPRVAVIDDDPFVGRSIQRILGQRYAVDVFSDAREALRRVEAGAEYALVLCDLMMPAMSGMAFCDALEASHPEVVERCVWMTGGAFTEEAVAFVAARRASCVEKPFEAAELRALAAGRCAGV